MNVSIIGFNGFIGSQLAAYFKDQGISVKGIFREDFNSRSVLKKKIKESDVVINMSGESIAGVWTKKRKKRIYESRVMVTREIIESINDAENELLFINASAVGIYDNKGIHSERSEDYKNDFLSKVIIDWENEVYKIRRNKTRWVILRMGIVIDRKGGYLGKSDFLLKRGFCIMIGKRNEYIPLISVKELYNIISFIISNKKIKGILNAVGPYMVTVEEFYKRLKEIKGIKFCVKIPDICLKVILREASVIFMEGQYVIPEKLETCQFDFKERSLKDMLTEVFKKQN